MICVMKINMDNTVLAKQNRYFREKQAPISGTLSRFYFYKNPMNHTTSYEYDGINRNTKIIYPDLRELTITYDKASNIATRTDPNGTVVTNTYDSLNRLITRSIITGTGVGGVTNEGYAYDALGRLTSGGDNLSGSLIFTYDALNRLMSEYERPTG